MTQTFHGRVNNGFSGHVEVIVDDGAIEIVPEQEAPIDCASLARAT